MIWTLEPILAYVASGSNGSYQKEKETTVGLGSQKLELDQLWIKASTEE